MVLEALFVSAGERLTGYTARGLEGARLGATWKVYSWMAVSMGIGNVDVQDWLEQSHTETLPATRRVWRTAAASYLQRVAVGCRGLQRVAAGRSGMLRPFPAGYSRLQQATAHSLQLQGLDSSPSLPDDTLTPCPPPACMSPINILHNSTAADTAVFT